MYYTSICICISITLETFLDTITLYIMNNIQIKSCLLCQKMKYSQNCLIRGEIQSPGNFDASTMLLLYCCVQVCIFEKVYSLFLRTTLIHASKIPWSKFFEISWSQGFQFELISFSRCREIIKNRFQRLQISGKKC